MRRRRFRDLPGASAADGIFAVLFVTGAVWLIADALKDSPSGDFWQGISASLLTIHGGAAMVPLVLLGALIPVHVMRAWRSRRNRVAGAAMVIANVLFIATAFGLYYAGSDIWRPWISDVHIAVGLIFPALMVIHVLTGRRRAPAADKESSG
jgi:predicted lysophospholipase L1 biosynthesis ABC-type transport system permease subunit